MPTIKEWLVYVATHYNYRTEDGMYMQLLLRKFGFKKVKILAGVVYLEGIGSMEAAPISLREVAREIMLGGND